MNMFVMNRPIARTVLAWGLMLCVLPALTGYQSTRADILVRALDSGASPGGTGSFDIVLENTGTSAQDSIFVASFSVQFSLDSGTPVQFIDANTNTDPDTAPYVFGSQQLPPFTSDTFPNQSMTVTDTLLTYPPGYVEVHAQEVFGLAHIVYQIDLSAPLKSSYTVHFDMVNQSPGTQLVDFFGNAIPISLTVEGQISVVPEPSSLMLGSVLASIGLIVRFRTNRGTKAQSLMKRKPAACSPGL